MSNLYARAIAALTICLSANVGAAAPYTPARGTADRAAIMDSIRRGTGSDSVFVVDYLKVTLGDGAKLAFAEVHPASPSAASPFRGWAVLKRETGERWQTLWGVRYGTPGTCRGVKVAYTNAIEAASRFDASMTMFSPEFRRDHVNVLSRSDDGVCGGKLFVGD